MRTLVVWMHGEKAAGHHGPCENIPCTASWTKEKLQWTSDLTAGRALLEILCPSSHQGLHCCVQRIMSWAKNSCMQVRNVFYSKPAIKHL